MKAKYKKGKIFTDYFSGPGEYQEFELLENVYFNGSIISNIKLYDSRTKLIYRNYPNTLRFNIKKYNELFFTKNELRAKKLKRLNEKNII